MPNIMFNTKEGKICYQLHLINYHNYDASRVNDTVYANIFETIIFPSLD